MNKIIVQQETEILKIIRDNLDDWIKYKIWLLEGPLGVGKTTFVKYFLKALDPAFSNVRSPSFSLVHTYDTDKFQIIHSDFYRVESGTFDNFGLHEYLEDENTICIIEWPEKLSKIPDIPYLHIKFSFNEEKFDNSSSTEEIEEHADNPSRILTIEKCN